MYKYVGQPLLRFMSKVKVSETCWHWIGMKNKGGYGIFSDKNKKKVAHKWLYELLIMPVDKGLDLDHLCRNRNCVNPEHLEQVTRSENLRRGIGPKLAGLRQSTKTHCKQGHEFTDENIMLYKDRPGRKCKTCHRIRERNRRNKLKQKEQTNGL